MNLASQFRELFTARGQFQAGDGQVEVAFITTRGHRLPGTLTFRNGLCISADIGGEPWVYPDGSPLSGLQLKLAFDDEGPLTVLVNDGRVLTRDVPSADANLSAAFQRTERSGVVISPRARVALLSLPLTEQIAVLDSVARMAERPRAEWLAEVTQLSEDKPIYLIEVDDLRVFVHAPDGDPFELIDIMGEATLKAFLDRTRATTSGVK